MLCLSGQALHCAAAFKLGQAFGQSLDFLVLLLGRLGCSADELVVLVAQLHDNLLALVELTNQI